MSDRFASNNRSYFQQNSCEAMKLSLLWLDFHFIFQSEPIIVRNTILIVTGITVEATKVNDIFDIPHLLYNYKVGL